MGWTLCAQAGSSLEYAVQRGNKDRVQTIFIKNTQVLIQSAGGNPRQDLWYRSNSEQLALIDHKHRCYTLITEAKLERITRQTEDLQPVLRGLGEQLDRLSPKQKTKWGNLLGVDLDQAEALRQPPPEPVSLLKGRAGGKVAGIDCERMQARRGTATVAEVCLANPAMLKLPVEESTTLQAMFAYVRRLADKAQVLARFIRLPIPPLVGGELAGIPVEIRDGSGSKPMVMTLTRVAFSDMGDIRWGIPEGYEPRDLKFW